MLYNIYRTGDPVDNLYLSFSVTTIIHQQKRINKLRKYTYTYGNFFKGYTPLKGMPCVVIPSVVLILHTMCGFL